MGVNSKHLMHILIIYQLITFQVKCVFTSVVLSSPLYLIMPGNKFNAFLMIDV